MKSGRPPVTSRAQILKVARRILQKQGIGALSVRAVAAELSTAPSTIYNYFGTKDGFLAALANELLQDARPSAEPGDDPVDALRRWMIDHRKLLLKIPDLIVLANLLGPVASVYRIGGGLFEMLKRAGFSDADAALETRTLHLTVSGFVLQEIGQKRLGNRINDGAPFDALELMVLTQRIGFEELFLHIVDRNINGLLARLPGKPATRKARVVPASIA